MGEKPSSHATISTGVSSAAVNIACSAAAVDLLSFDQTPAKLVLQLRVGSERLCASPVCHHPPSLMSLPLHVRKTDSFLQTNKAASVLPTRGGRVFDETLFRIFAKHKTRGNAPVFREIFASFARSNFRDFRVSRKL
jgi:hypothetical protein